jgi:hypothetical protein
VCNEAGFPERNIVGYSILVHIPYGRIDKLFNTPHAVTSLGGVFHGSSETPIPRALDLINMDFENWPGKVSLAFLPRTKDSLPILDVCSSAFGVPDNDQFPIAFRKSKEITVANNHKPGDTARVENVIISVYVLGKK